MSMMFQSSCCSIQIIKVYKCIFLKVQNSEFNFILGFRKIGSVINQTIDQFQIIQKNNMLKKIKTSSQLPRQPSLKKIIDQSKNYTRSNDLKQLFLPQSREIFELSYLLKSPHYNHDNSYTELVKIIEKYNNQTIQIQNQNSLTKQFNNFNKIKLACMRLIYRQLLSIAVMEDWQIKKCDLASKIKNWYYNLGQHHSFLQGVNFKKRKQSIIERQIEENVRSTYISNVFDEIDDYMRKEIDFNSSNKKDTFYSRKKYDQTKNEFDNINLPFIDLLLYKREDARLREIRQKEYQSQYFSTLLKNKNQMRQKALLRLKNIQNTRQKIRIDECEKKSTSTFATQQNFYPLIKRQSFIQRNPFKTRLELFKSKQNITRLSLSNINGINLINYKIE